MKKCFLSFLFLCSLPSIFSMDVSEEEAVRRDCILTWIMVLDKLERADAINALKSERKPSLSQEDREFAKGVGLIDEEGCLSPLVREVVKAFKCAATN